MSKQPDQLHLRSHEVQEILSRPPHALIRYGILLVSAIVLSGFVASIFFIYPDRVEGAVSITGSTPPVWVVTRSEGMLSQLFCTDQQTVQKGEVLAVIQNPASTQDVLNMRSLLDETVFEENKVSFPDQLLNDRFELGTMQPAYSQFVSDAIAYRNFLQLNLSEKEQIIISQQLKNRGDYRKIILNQISNKEKEVDIARSVYQRDKLLYEQKVLAQSELELAEQLYLSRKNELEQLKTTASLESIESLQLTGSLQKLSIGLQREKNQLYSALKSSLMELETALSNWQYNYLLAAPASGTISFNGIWNEQQYITKDQKIMAVVSESQSSVSGRMLMPVSGAGKVKTGQQVLVKIDDYPYLEFGMLKGRVKKSSLVPDKQFFAVEIAFDKVLTTTTGKQLQLQGELNGRAEIITNKQSLLARIMSPVIYLIHRSKALQ
jgi:HlyD family secretion protein